MASYPDQQSPGAFVPTTNIWDPAEIYQIDVTSELFKELMVRLYQNLNIISSTLNLKDTGYYTPQEIASGQSFFPDPALSATTAATPEYRGAYRILVNVGQLPNSATKSVPHNVDVLGSFSFTRIYGTASDTNGRFYIPLPYASANPITLNVDATNVNITTTNDATRFNVCYVVLEYLKS